MEDPNEANEFVMTDYAFIEMFKSSHWELVSRQSLAILAEYPETVVVTRAPTDILNSELEQQIPATEWSSIVDEALTQRTRSYLQELASQGQNGPGHAYVSSMIESAQESLPAQQLNHQDNLDMLHNGVEAWREALRPDALSDLRGGRMADQTRAFLAVEISKIGSRTLLLEHGATEQQADHFLLGDSFLLRSQVSFALLSLQRLQLGSVQGMRADRATNELMDIDYALFGSYCDGVLTNEASVTRHHQLLVEAVNIINSPA